MKLILMCVGASVVSLVLVSSSRRDLGECCVVGVWLLAGRCASVECVLVCVFRRCGMAMMITG